MNGFGLYVHWPYCSRKCPYCDFNSHVRDAIDEESWCAAILTEMAAIARLQGEDRPGLSTIFFGGGTPSLMHGASVGRIVEQAARLWNFAPDIEISLESNPASAEAARFADYRAAGVNRLSLGVQAFDDTALKFLGRLHDAAEAKAAIALALNTFERVSFDLIYARPGQSAAEWKGELAEALAFGVEHLSLYQLTIEKGTPFFAMQQRGAIAMPLDEASAALFDLTQDITEAAGMPAYEISNHARPGRECRHNLLYWRYESYAGVGPGAHGRLDLFSRRYATANERHPERWRALVAEKGQGFATVDEIGLDTAAGEHVLMSLRLAEGLDLDDYAARWGKTLDETRITPLIELGLVRRNANRLAATASGRLLLNRVIEELAD